MQNSKLFSIIAVALLVSVVFAGLTSIPAAAQTDTMQFHYNAQHTGDYSPVAGSNMSNSKLAWKYTTGGWVFSSPAVANGVVYVGSKDGNVYALNANTGTELWSFPTGGGAYSSPTVVNGIIYAGSGDSNTYAIGNAATATSQGTTPGFEVMLAFVTLAVAAYAAKRKS